MQNRYKFRAWDNREKEMVYNVHLDPDNWLEELIEEPQDGDVLMQFTGLLDKNGKEIYEGDIVGKEGVYHFIERKGWEPNQGDWKIIGEKSKNFTGEGDEKYIAGYELEVVDWQNTGFYPFADSPNNCGHCGGGSNSSDFEIIGNIYENPELIHK